MLVVATDSDDIFIFRYDHKYILNQTLSFSSGLKRVNLQREYLLILVESEDRAYTYKNDGISYEKIQQISSVFFPSDISITPNNKLLIISTSLRTIVYQNVDDANRVQILNDS